MAPFGRWPNGARPRRLALGRGAPRLGSGDVIGLELTSSCIGAAPLLVAGRGAAGLLAAVVVAAAQMAAAAAAAFASQMTKRKRV